MQLFGLEETLKISKSNHIHSWASVRTSISPTDTTDVSWPSSRALGTELTQTWPFSASEHHTE